LGRQTDEPGPVSDYTDMDIYYRSIQHDAAQSKRDRLTIHDYLWRWDTDWFWCSRAFGAQHPKYRRFWPKRYRRSSFYWKLIALDHRYHVSDRLEARQGNPPRERVVQDIEVPVERTADFVEWFLREIPIEPIWLCPLRLRDTGGESGTAVSTTSERAWPLYPLEPNRTYVNVGFWSAVPTVAGRAQGAANRAIEQTVTEFDGHKSLYSDSYYGKDEFAALYGGETYTELKKRYDPDQRLLDLYSKAVQRK
jgi:FAD/FMN-containing dehydrogenase